MAAVKGDAQVYFFCGAVDHYPDAGDITAELKKVVWLSPREAAYLTGVVIILTVIAGVALGFIDMGFTNLVNNVFLGG